VGGVLLASSVLASGTAQAFYDGTSPRVPFLTHVHALRFVGAHGDEDLVSMGYEVCHAIKTGHSVPEMTGMAETTLAPKGYTVSEADGFVNYAINDLCPNAGR
jgi:hypothetical protein